MIGTEIKTKVWGGLREHFEPVFENPEFGVWTKNLFEAILDLQVAKIDLDRAESLGLELTCKAVSHEFGIIAFGVMKLV